MRRRERREEEEHVHRSHRVGETSGQPIDTGDLCTFACMTCVHGVNTDKSQSEFHSLNIASSMHDKERPGKTKRQPLQDAWDTVTRTVDPAFKDADLVTFQLLGNTCKDTFGVCHKDRT